MKLKNDEYIIEIDDILNNSSIDETDLVEEFGDNYDKALFELSRKTYRAIYKSYRGIDREVQAKAIRYMIKNSENLKTGLMYAIIEYVRWALTTGQDIQEYVDGKFMIPSFLEDELRHNGLWFAGKIQYVESQLT